MGAAQWKGDQIERLGEFTLKNIHAAMARPHARCAVCGRNSPSGESQSRKAGELPDLTAGEFCHRQRDARERTDNAGVEVTVKSNSVEASWSCKGKLAQKSRKPKKAPI